MYATLLKYLMIIKIKLIEMRFSPTLGLGMAGGTYQMGTTVARRLLSMRSLHGEQQWQRGAKKGISLERP